MKDTKTPSNLRGETPMKTANDLMLEIQCETFEAQQTADLKEIARLMSKYSFLKRSHLYKKIVKWAKVS